MKFELPKLPYSIDALTPFISAETLEFHYERHHRAYVDKLNQLILGTPFVNASLEEIIQRANGSLFNNAAQAWNHSFYWNSLRPLKQPNEMSTFEGQSFINQVKADFGTVDELKRCMKECGLSAFGSGWIWLIQDQLGHLRVTSTQNADNPLRSGSIPLLACDVWEHAYYIDYRNERSKYMDSFLELANFAYASQRFEHQKTGEYNQMNSPITITSKKAVKEKRRTSYVG